MKIRKGFVSNSSSSSFVVIGKKGDDSHKVINIIEDGALTLGELGHDEFGWGPETIKDVFSRINFAKIQSDYNKSWFEMLEKVIKEKTGCKTITWQMDNFAYIDHQSHASEGENIEIFENEKVLKQFLFCFDSLIELDNDNR
jgi:hypothetical protein